MELEDLQPHINFSFLFLIKEGTQGANKAKPIIIPVLYIHVAGRRLLATYLASYFIKEGTQGADEVKPLGGINKERGMQTQDTHVDMGQEGSINQH